METETSTSTGFFRKQGERMWHIRTENNDGRRFDAACGVSLHLDSGLSPVIDARSSNDPPQHRHVCRQCRLEIEG
jgi:hypothetical protein